MPSSVEDSNPMHSAPSSTSSFFQVQEGLKKFLYFAIGKYLALLLVNSPSPDTLREFPARESSQGRSSRFTLGSEADLSGVLQ